MGSWELLVHEADGSTMDPIALDEHAITMLYRKGQQAPATLEGINGPIFAELSYPDLASFTIDGVDVPASDAAAAVATGAVEVLREYLAVC